ncbi:Ig-like domain-containing protein [Siminovitchia sp. 179-K 8D1 HS]|uniref:S8 family peptidase n=1 Tax=Siminovitchia sp. 179-K 8D1 HS TaxID=3142385 RepID=UPI0039A0D0D3
MKKKRQYTAVLVVFMFMASFLQPLASHASEAEPGDGIQLQKNEKVEGEFFEPGEVHWYKIVPTADEIGNDSHMRIKLTGTFDGNVSVYPDWNRAEEDITFDDYRGYIGEGVPVEIDMPHAWEGPYFIKVEYLGSINEEEYGEEQGDPDSTKYQIGYEGVTLSPLMLSGEPCPVELSTDKQKSGEEILTQLRRVRDNLLSKTDKGKELSSLYYKTAPFLVSKMVFNQNIRETVYKQLIQLKPMFKDIAEKGENSNYRITKGNQEAINELYGIVLQHVPNSFRSEIEQIGKEMGIGNLVGKRISDVIKANGLAISKENGNRVIVKLKSGNAASSFQKNSKKLFESATIKSLGYNGHSVRNTYVLKVADDAKKAADRLMTLPEVEYAEPVYQYHKKSFNDLQYLYQWGLENTGRDSGIRGADIKFPNLFEVLNKKELKDVVIAVADTGVDYTLADLNKKVDTDKGYDFINGDGDPSDDEGHGTHVAGIIAAGINNGYSMTGIHPTAKIMPVKVLDAGGSGETDQIALGIKYAVDNGAKVINLSLGGPPSRVIEEMLKYAASKNVTVVAASGNDGGDMVDYPASSQYTIGVGATNRLDIVTDLSSYGKGLDLVAPGVDIPSLLPNGNVTYLSGTSMATPHVAAVSGLLLAANPNMKPNEIRQILTSTANDIAVKNINNGFEIPDGEDPDDEEFPTEPGYDEASGWGRLNAWSAFSVVDLNLSIAPLTDVDTKITGKAVKGTKLELKAGNHSLGKGEANADGTFSIPIEPQKGNEILHLEAENGPAKAAVRVTVQETPPLEPPDVNPVSDRDAVVTGKATPGATISVKTKKAEIGTGKADQHGTFKVNIKKQKAGTILYVTAAVSGKTSETSEVVVIDKTPPAAPKVKTVTDRDTTVNGTTEKDATVFVKHKDKVIGKNKADAKGNFKVVIKKQKAGTTLHVTAKDTAGNESKAAKVAVQDKTPPAVPKVKAVTDRDKVVAGTTEAKATVYVKHKGKTIGKKKADAKGNFKVEIKKQKAGTTLHITAKDAAGNESKAAKVAVQDKTPPAVPKVKAVTDRDKAVAGTTEAKATVYVKHKGKTIGKKKADAKGKFKVPIKKQKAKTTLHVTAKDAAGNISKAAKVKVKKHKK